LALVTTPNEGLVRGKKAREPKSVRSGVEVAEEFKELVELVERIVDGIRAELETIELRSANWLDNYNGRPDRITYDRGVVIEELKGILNYIVEYAYPPEGQGAGAHVTNVYLTLEHGLVAQLEEDYYNPYGSHVGTEKWWTEVTTMLEMAKRRVEKYKVAELRRVKEEVMTELSKV